jgi:hypothetical protein
MRTFVALGLAMTCLWLAVPAAAQETRGALFFAGFSTPAAMAADQAANINTGRANALYGLPTSGGYQSARSARFQVKFSF